MQILQIMSTFAIVIVAVTTILGVYELVSVPLVLIFAFIAVLGLTLARRELQVKFFLERFREHYSQPIESDWSVRILHPNKLIEKCAIFYDGVKLPWWNSEKPVLYERRIMKDGGANFRIPKNIEKEDAEVIVRDGKRKLRKIKFSELLETPP